MGVVSANLNSGVFMSESSLESQLNQSYQLEMSGI